MRVRPRFATPPCLAQLERTTIHQKDYRRPLEPQRWHIMIDQIGFTLCRSTQIRVYN
ncbi:hypothetical protein FIBSPDRAFT_855272 [Athelia psychrophila]|uniref:Uncharacterized protein n=1 Tax=Athelia psychrophila TaxID=1759441 RepID=A0A166PDK9_9AGAM|nr:hypothetical protein FIBSPDRAFT_855272 [Fibularhizoctonia sp. CBS 109695]